METTRDGASGSFELPQRVSTALAVVSALTAGLSFVFWEVFHRDVPMSIGNMRGTALTILLLGVPLLLLSMAMTARGSLRALFVWLGSLAYIAYNAVMFCFAAHFNAFFLLFTALLALSFWSLLTLLAKVEPEALAAACSRVPRRSLSVYLVLSSGAFAALWLEAIVPATLRNETPIALSEAGITQNPVWVLDFAFTFPLVGLASVWLWKSRPWGYILAGTMVTMLTLETAGIVIDQIFGHVHDPTAPLGAVPILLVFTAAGLAFSVLFLRGVEARRPHASDPGLFARKGQSHASLAGPSA